MILYPPVISAARRPMQREGKPSGAEVSMQTALTSGQEGGRREEGGDRAFNLATTTTAGICNT